MKAFLGSKWSEIYSFDYCITECIPFVNLYMKAKKWNGGWIQFLLTLVESVSVSKLFEWNKFSDFLFFPLIWSFKLCGLVFHAWNKKCLAKVDYLVIIICLLAFLFWVLGGKLGALTNLTPSEEEKNQISSFTYSMQIWIKW